MKNKSVQKLEKKIFGEIKNIESLEKEIKKSEENISKNLTQGIKTMSKDGINYREASLIKKSILRKIAKHKFLFTVLVTLGVVLVWRGFWGFTESIPFLENSLVSLIIGFSILWLIEQYTEL